MINGRIAIKIIQLIIAIAICMGCRPDEFDIGAISVGISYRYKF
jgi:hypothetical protein